MKKIISNTVTFIAAIVGFIGGCIWAYKSNWDMEPIVLVIISFVEICGFIATKVTGEPDLEGGSTSNAYKQKIVNRKKVAKQINIQKNKGDIIM